MHILRLSNPAPEDLRRLGELDTSFTTAAVLDVSATPGGFTLTERNVPARTKRYDLLAGHREADPPWDVILLAITEREVVGMAATTYQRWNTRQVLDEVHVAPAHRRRGIARALLRDVEDLARGNGAREVWVETQNTNPTAVRAYRALRFELTGLDTTLYGPADETEAALFMSRPVIRS
ncbi:hypothetical protein NUM3379_18700 [Kineococcus sp. NUM-3379]